MILQTFKPERLKGVKTGQPTSSSSVLALHSQVFVFIRIEMSDHHEGIILFLVVFNVACETTSTFDFNLGFHILNTTFLVL